MLYHAKKQFDDILRRMERSRGWRLQQELVDWMDRKEQRTRGTQQGLADVDAGSVIDHSIVERWADRLDSDHPLPPPTLGK